MLSDRAGDAALGVLHDSNPMTAFAAARASAVAATLLWHIDLTLALKVPDYQVHEKVFDVLWYVPMPMFFLLIGITFSDAVRSGRLPLLSRTVVNYFYVYLVWMLIYHAVYLFIDRGVVETGTASAIRHWLLPAPELWFLVWFSVGLSLATVLRRVPATLQIVSMILLAWLLLGPDYRMRDFMVYTLGFVFLGIYGRPLFMRIVQLPVWPTIALAAGLYASILLLFDRPVIVAAPFAPQVLSLLGIVVSIAAMRAVVSTRLGRRWALLGRNAFAIYILSPFWVVVDCEIVARFLTDHLSDAVTAWLPAPLLVVVIIQALATKRLLQPLPALFVPPKRIAATAGEWTRRRLVSATLPWPGLRGALAMRNRWTEVPSGE